VFPTEGELVTKQRTHHLKTTASALESTATQNVEEEQEIEKIVNGLPFGPRSPSICIGADQEPLA
jgi:hypothetical protein